MDSSFLPRRAIIMGRQRATSIQHLPAASLSSEVSFAGEGTPQAELVFVTESTSEQSEAEQLLSRMIQAMGLRPDQVYIFTVTKPGCETSTITTTALERELDAIAPKVVVALGDFAAGMLSTYRGTKLMPTFHPAYLLRNPDKKREAWTHLQKVATELGLDIPKRS